MEAVCSYTKMGASIKAHWSKLLRSTFTIVIIMVMTYGCEAAGSGGITGPGQGGQQGGPGSGHGNAGDEASRPKPPYVTYYMKEPDAEHLLPEDFYRDYMGELAGDGTVDKEGRRRRGVEEGGYSMGRRTNYDGYEGRSDIVYEGTPLTRGEFKVFFTRFDKWRRSVRMRPKPICD